MNLALSLLNKVFICLSKLFLFFSFLKSNITDSENANFFKITPKGIEIRVEKKFVEVEIQNYKYLHLRKFDALFYL